MNNKFKITSNELETFFNDTLKYHISNVYLNNHDIEFNSKEIYNVKIERFKTLKSRIISIPNGLIIELNNNIFYKFSCGFGVCDYHLKLSKPKEFPISKNYTNIRNTNISVLKWLINKKPCNIIPTICHNKITALKGLEFWNNDKSKFSIIGHHFEFKDELGNYEFYDGTWLLIDKLAIENMNYI